MKRFITPECKEDYLDLAIDAAEELKGLLIMIAENGPSKKDTDLIDNLLYEFDHYVSQYHKEPGDI